MNLERSGNMITLLFQLMFLPVYLVFYMFALLIKMLFTTFKAGNKLLSSVGLGLLFHDLFD